MRIILLQMSFFMNLIWFVVLFVILINLPTIGTLKQLYSIVLAFVLVQVELDRLLFRSVLYLLFRNFCVYYFGTFCLFFRNFCVYYFGTFVFTISELVLTISELLVFTISELLCFLFRVFTILELFVYYLGILLFTISVLVFTILELLCLLFWNFNNENKL